MFQHANRRQRIADVTRPRSAEPAIASPTVGKRTLTAPSGPLGAPNGYARAIEAARRDLHAVRTIALPAYVAALRRTDLAPLDKQIKVTDAALQLRHLLMTANQHVSALEKGATYRNSLILLLRQQLGELATRATRVGAYRGAEDMIPRPYIQPRPQTRADAKVRVRQRLARGTGAPAQADVRSSPTPTAWTTASRSRHAKR